MQGPEQGLVGEARSDSATGPAEEAKPGERGVGEIVNATELRRHIERKISEARMHKDTARYYGNSRSAATAEGKETALTELLETIDRISTERSDLANSKILPE